MLRGLWGLIQSFRKLILGLGEFFLVHIAQKGQKSDEGSHAQFSLGEYEAAIEAYESGLKLDPGNSNMKAALATAKIRYAEESSNAVADREPPSGGAGGGAGGMPDLSALAGMMGGLGGGGGGGGGGMPDLASMMQNPQMMAMYVKAPSVMYRTRSR